VSAETVIADPALRRKFADNSDLILRLRQGLAGPAVPQRLAALVTATIAKVARRTGYEEFAFLARLGTKPSLPSELSRRLALILIAKLEEQNAVIPILDRFAQRRPAAKRPLQSANSAGSRRG
jgi:hypothetical protein